MRYSLIIAIALTFLGCDKDNVTTLNGKWVDVNTKTDTLTFGLFGDKESLVLGRGKETNGGFLLPKSGSGPYEYKLLTGDKISLHLALSSNSNFNDYYFKQTGGALIIEKFFDTTTAGTMLTFKKLE